MSEEKENIMTIKKYRPNVGLMIINPRGQVWLGQRTNSEKFKYKMQMPQGGIDEGENITEAAYRELWEETGLTKDKVKLICISNRWYSYRFFKPISFGHIQFIGQSQKWFLFLHNGEDSDFNLQVHPEEIEFASFEWHNIDDIISHIVPFKRDVYRKVIQEFKPIIQKLITSDTLPDSN